jgi:hypothetical protein
MGTAVMTIKNNREWTFADEDFLEENWGKMTITAISKKLGKTRGGITNRATLLKLGPWRDSCEFMSLYKLAKTIGVDRKLLLDFSKDRGFPIKIKRVDLLDYYVVDVDAFWKWAESNKARLNFKNFEEGAIGKEPDWADEKRRSDVREYKIRTKSKTQWTTKEISFLRALCESGKYTYPQMSEMLRRSESSIKSKVIKFELPKPNRMEKRPWSCEEIETMLRMLQLNKSYAEIGIVLGRSDLQVRSKCGKLLNSNECKAKLGKDCCEWVGIDHIHMILPPPVVPIKKKKKKRKF